MSRIIYGVLILLWASIPVIAQPPGIGDILQKPEFIDRQINEWGEYETTVRFQDIVKWHGIATYFGIRGNASAGGVLVVMTDPDVGGTSDDYLIYGAYSDRNSPAFIHAESFETLYEPWYSGDLGMGSEVPSTRFRTRVHQVERNFSAQLQEKYFKAWGRHRMRVKIVVVTFGASEMADFEFALPGIYEDPINGRLLTSADFNIDYQTYGTLSWQKPGNDLRPTMIFEGDEIEVRSNETEIESADTGTEDVVFEVWGKMLVTRPGENSPEINSNYDYGLWVAGEIVSEDFLMHPREGWADHVFQPEYRLPTLDSMQAYIQKHGHLPNMPSEQQVIDKGYTQHEMNVRLLENIEQLTLHQIRQQRDLEEMTQTLMDQRKMIKEVRVGLGEYQRDPK